MLEIETLPEEIGFLRAFFNQKNTADPKQQKNVFKGMPCSFSLPSIGQLETLANHSNCRLLVFFLTWSIGNKKKRKKEKEKYKRSDHPPIKETWDRKGVDNFLLPGYQTRLCFFSDTCRHSCDSRGLHRFILWMWF